VSIRCDTPYLLQFYSLFPQSRPIDAMDNPPYLDGDAQRPRGQDAPVPETRYQRVARIELENAELREQVTLRALEDEQARLRLALEAHRPLATEDSTSTEETSSAAALTTLSDPPDGGAPGRSMVPRLKLREPRKFKGDTLANARDYLRDLDTLFAFGETATLSDRDKVIYAVNSLGGPAADQWFSSIGLKTLRGTPTKISVISCATPSRTLRIARLP
jgi:hypothetical protein